jgi:hypothetical protein
MTLQILSTAFAWKPRFAVARRLGFAVPSVAASGARVVDLRAVVRCFWLVVKAIRALKHPPLDFLYRDVPPAHGVGECELEVLFWDRGDPLRLTRQVAGDPQLPKLRNLSFRLDGFSVRPAALVPVGIREDLAEPPHGTQHERGRRVLRLYPKPPPLCVNLGGHADVDELLGVLSVGALSQERDGLRQV